ncbi:hypothetical protein O7632_26375 [Solwaraspora sp. WMMD406]|uniref:SCO7613 C-terminal domain-containing membrane protein n=1 Tax=Solwaraspora sp. WMMD406 TaxID=3016095 RepID=UPI00241755C6|nr:hypothetical protein [Solwaraspora sp. WMMD406]MDG4767591.1 hypothetical protein [Solwaraspora sp. WMMD406]
MSSTVAPRYPCPVCGAGATLAAPCPGCGRAPDPIAAEVIRLDGELAALSARTEQARQAWLALSGQLRAVGQRRHQLAAQVQSAVRASARPGVRAPLPAAVPPVPVPVAGQPGPVPPVAGQPGPVPPVPRTRPEASIRTVQNVLFVLGGLLLGTAAIVFTAVAWTTVGVGGRAAILAGVTAVVLALPPLANWRGLRGTAETFAAIGLLLVLLDGYAARYVNLFGAGDLPAARYAAAAFAATALVAAGYHQLTGLAAARFATLTAAQPVLVLLAVDTRPDAAGTTLFLLGVAALNLALIVLAAPAWRVLRIAGWALFGLALAAAGIAALVALLLGHPTRLPVLAGVPLLAVVAVAFVAALTTGNRLLVAVSLAAVPPALGLAAVRAGTELWPSLTGLCTALVALGLALAGAAARRRLPATVRLGPWAGAVLVNGVYALITLLVVAAVAVTSVLAARPLWQAGDATRGGAPTIPADWQLPVSVLLISTALAVLMPRIAWSGLFTVGWAALLLAVPAAVPMPWWTVGVLGLVAGVAFAVRAVRAPHLREALPSAGVAVLLTGHAVLVGLGRPIAATAMVGVVVAAGLAVAAIGRRVGSRPGAGAHHEIIGGIGAAVAVVGWPVVVALAVFTADVPAGWPARAAVAAITVLPAALVAVRRWWPGHLVPAATATTLAAVGAGFAPALAGMRFGPAESAGGYAAWAALVVVVAVLSTPTGLLRVRQPQADRSAADPATAGPAAADPATPDPATSGALPAAGLRIERGSLWGLRLMMICGAGLLALPAVASVLPALGAVLLRPYTWVDGVWTGVPVGVGLSPAGALTVPASAAVTLAVLTAGAAALAWWRPVAAPPSPARTRRLALAAIPTGLLTLLVALAAASAPWPIVPALTLLGGLAALVAAARAATVLPVVPVALPLGVLLTVAGLAGALPVQASTLTALALLVAVAAAIGVAGRRAAVRVVGWVAAVAAGTVLAVSSGRAADLPARTTGYAVLAVAALALAVGALLIRYAGPRGAVQTQAQAQARAGRRGESVAVEAAGHAAAVTALLMTIGSARHAAAVCTLWGVALGVRAVAAQLTGATGATGATETTPAAAAVADAAGHRPSLLHRPWVLGVAALAAEIGAWWLLLTTAQVSLTEAYTLPPALAALALGWWALRTHPTWSSWLGYGPGLAAALLPSLGSVLVLDGQPVRRLLLGAGAVAVVLAGAAYRRQAPVVLGGAVLVVVAVRELVAVWDLLPRWSFLAVGGLALITLAVTYERRRRDVHRLRSAVGRMS